MEKYNNELDFRRLIREIKRLKWVYLAAFIVFMGAGIAYYLRSMPEYTAVGKVLIEDSSENTPSAGAGGVSAIMRSFSIGGFGSSSVDNEIEIMQSNKLRLRVVKLLRLNRIYVERDGLKKKMLYRDTPVLVEPQYGMLDTLTSAMMVRMSIKDDKVSAKVTQGRIFKKTIAEVKNAELPCVISTPYGYLQILKSTSYVDSIKADIDVTVMGDEAASKLLSEQLYMEISDAKTDVISMTYDCPNRARGMQVVNTVMNEYNKIRVERRHFNARQEIEYFKNRLIVVERSLKKSETNLENFVKEKDFVGGEQIAGMLIGGTVGKKEELIRLQAQIDYYNDVLKTLKSGNMGDLLPVMETSKNSAVEAYNEAIMKRKSLELSATPENKSLQLLNSQIDYLRDFVKGNMELMLNQAEMNMATLNQLTDVATDKINKLPELEREYATLLRDQKFNQELYMFLLQKKESAELKFYSNSTLGFVFEEAYSDLAPNNNKAMIMLIIALLLSIILPTLLAIFLLYLRNKIYQPMDLKSIGIEENAEIFVGDKKKIASLRQLMLGSGRRVFAVVDYGVNSEIRNVISSSFKNVDKTVYWDDSLNSNDQFLTDNFNARLGELEKKYDIIFTIIPEKDSLDIISMKLKEDKCGMLVLIPSGKVKINSLKNELTGIDLNSVYTLITE
ncbi:MAG: Wzz/FepE/Etk N-terminal domain-containing protein [Bacteroides sp.]|nr:Wzz/FepE/Etk N-terminal domain-containing protein [Bacteroides sp.]MCM1390231.1 Wzz/FepE/Etk N-terminal domain-containing protein [Bacteroides sp.]